MSAVTNIYPSNSFVILKFYPSNCRDRGIFSRTSNPVLSSRRTFAMLTWHQMNRITGDNFWYQWMQIASVIGICLDGISWRFALSIPDCSFILFCRSTDIFIWGTDRTRCFKIQRFRSEENSNSASLSLLKNQCQNLTFIKIKKIQKLRNYKKKCFFQKPRDSVHPHFPTFEKSRK